MPKKNFWTQKETNNNFPHIKWINHVGFSCKNKFSRVIRVVCVFVSEISTLLGQFSRAFHAHAHTLHTKLCPAVKSESIHLYRCTVWTRIRIKSTCFMSEICLTKKSATAKTVRPSNLHVRYEKFFSTSLNYAKKWIYKKLAKFTVDFRLLLAFSRRHFSAVLWHKISWEQKKTNYGTALHCIIQEYFFRDCQIYSRSHFW